jgi:hypothetical protein
MFEDVVFRKSLKELVLETSTDSAVASLKSYPQKLVQLLADTRRAIAQVKADPRLSAQGQEEEIARIRQEAQQKLESMWEAAKATYDNLVMKLTRIVNQNKQDTPEQLLAEVRAMRIWGRFKNRLDAAKSRDEVIRIILELADRAAHDRDVLALKVLAEELPDYLPTRGIPNADDVLAKVDDLLAGFDSPEVQAARELRNEVIAGWVRVDVDFRMALRELKGEGTIYGLTGWNGETIYTS